MTREDFSMAHAFDNIYPLGLGTSRFSFTTKEAYSEEFERAVNLVLYALDNGINYVDSARHYAFGHAYDVLKEAFRRTDRPFHASLKVNAMNPEDTTDDFYREALSVLDALGLERTSHFLMWSIMDVEQYHRAIGKNGLYEAALRLRDEGRVEHIGASLHLKREGMMEAIDSGLFSFLLLSCNLINYLEMQPVLDHALEKNVDIIVMNPLYGGLIPQNEALFDNARFAESEGIVDTSIRALLAHPAIKCVLAGASSREQLDAYLSAARGMDRGRSEERLNYLKKALKSGGTFCSYCRYCAGCPEGIPVSELMNAQNASLLGRNAPAPAGREPKASEKMFFQTLSEKYGVVFETAENPCIRCGRCESLCTQHLPIMDSIREVYDLVKRTGYDLASRRRRFDDLLNGKGYRRVGFWPASAGTFKILELYQELFGSFPFDVVLFDSNKEMQGQDRRGYTIHAGEEAVRLGVECIMITSYQYRRIIHEQLRDLEEKGIGIVELYREEDVDWWW